MKKNERGNSLVIIAVIIIFVVAIIVAINENSNNVNGTNSSLLDIMKTKEERSIYIPKCVTIDYTTLVQDSTQYVGKDFTFTGQVAEVKTGYNNNIKLRVNVTPPANLSETAYSDTIYVTYEYADSEETRINEGNIITIYGKSEGLYSYTSLTGERVNLPSINAMYIDIKST